MKIKGFTLIELLVVVAIIAILSTIGLTLFTQFTVSAKNSVIKANHRNIVNVVKTEIANCKLDGNEGQVTRYYRSGASIFAPRNFRCRSGFHSELQVHFLALGFLDPVIQNTDFYKTLKRLESYDGKQYILKHLTFLLDGKPSNLLLNDIQRRNTIATLLSDWGLVSFVDPEQAKDIAPLRQIKVIPYKEKNEWQLCPKYNIGNSSKD